MKNINPASIAVNLSMRQFLRRDVVKWVANVLQQTGLPAPCLELELTESLLPHDMERMVGILERLASLVIKLALDDFSHDGGDGNFGRFACFDEGLIIFLRGLFSISSDRLLAYRGFFARWSDLLGCILTLKAQEALEHFSEKVCTGFPSKNAAEQKVRAVNCVKRSKKRL